MRSRVILIIVTALAALATSAPAAKGAPPPEGWGAAEFKIAAAYWGVSTPPMCASAAVEFDVPLPPGIVGLATQPEEAGTPCHMEIATAYAASGLYWQCLAVVHEYGHWMGLGHSADPSSPMATQLNNTIYVRGCATLAGIPRANVTKLTHKPFRLR